MIVWGNVRNILHQHHRLNKEAMASNAENKMNQLEREKPRCDKRRFCLTYMKSINFEEIMVIPPDLEHARKRWFSRLGL